MRIAVFTIVAGALLVSGCVYSSLPTQIPTDPPVQKAESNRGIRNPYETDKTPDTPYEVRKAEKERDDHLAGRTGPKYPPLFEGQKLK